MCKNCLSCKSLICDGNLISLPNRQYRKLRFGDSYDLHGRAAVKKIVIRQNKHGMKEFMSFKNSVINGGLGKVLLSWEMQIHVEQWWTSWNAVKRYKKEFTKNLWPDRRSAPQPRAKRLYNATWNTFPFKAFNTFKAPEKCYARDYLGVFEKTAIQKLLVFGFLGLIDIENNWKNDNGIEIIPWVARSPDLNIIENVWQLTRQNSSKFR